MRKPAPAHAAMRAGGLPDVWQIPVRPSRRQVVTPDPAGPSGRMQNSLPPGPASVSVLAGIRVDLAGTIGQAVLASLMPRRRLRISRRVVKRAMSRHNAKGRVDLTTYKATIDVAILAGDLTSSGEP